MVEQSEHGRLVVKDSGKVSVVTVDRRLSSKVVGMEVVGKMVVDWIVVGKVVV